MLPYFVESTFTSSHQPQMSETIDVLSLNNQKTDKIPLGLLIIYILVLIILIIKQTQEPLLIK